MATSYPSSKQSQPAVPTSGDKLSSPDHLTDTVTLWDTVEAIQDELLSGTYRADDTPVVMLAGAFGTAAGGPSFSTYPANRAAGWLLDAAASERLWASTVLPASWTTMTITLVWANAGAGSGDVNFVTYYGSGAAGTDLGTLPSSVTVIDTAGSAGVLVHSTTSAVSVPNPGGLNAIAPNRNGPAGSDTLTNDCALYAVILQKAS